MGFDILGLSDELMRAVSEAGYEEPTPIQRHAIPTVLMGRDVLGIAQTGTGKTASFTLPMLDILAQGRGRARMPRSLILEPTRELAAQVAENFEKYGKYHKLSKTLLIGGVSFGDQEADLERGVDVLIATPGRLIDHFERGKILLSGVDILVIDEADRMLDMGFIPDVERICSMMPQKHQTLFFSATMPPPVKQLADRFLKDPKTVEVSKPASTADTVTQYKVQVSPRGKRGALRTLLQRKEVATAIVFCNRKRDVRALHESLQRHNFSAVQLQGDMDQGTRTEMLAQFKAGDAKILVASDVAARGLDIPAVSHVFNFDVPMSPDDYVHRIGRTGRAGRSGEAVSLISPSEADSIAAVEKLIGKSIDILKIDGLKTSSDKRSKPQKDKPQKTKNEDQKDHRTTKPVDQSQSTSKHNKNKKKKAAKDNRRSPEPVIIGMGDHVPAFLLTPVK